MRLIDLTGRKFGRLTVLERQGTKGKNPMWLCQCDCGNTKIVSSPNLKSGEVKSCGCLKSEAIHALKFEDLTGQRFGRWMVIERAENKNGKVAWLCQCDCGNRKIVVATCLKNGHSKSCGCLQRESRETSTMTHGCCKGRKQTRLYRIWNGMRERCNNPSQINYDNYGGRGITVCDEWMQDFTEFQMWALNHGYEDHLSIDRIDNNKGYSPDNCRWITVKEQAQNRRPRKSRELSSEGGN